MSSKYDVSNIAFIDFIFTDWQSSKAKQDPEYPQEKILAGYKIDLLSLEDTEKFILARLSLLDQSLNLQDDCLPFCSEEELWSTPQKFAVTKSGAKKATKLCDSLEEANQYINEKNIVGFVEHRAARAKRCKYCPAAPVCNQFDLLKTQGLIEF